MLRLLVSLSLLMSLNSGSAVQQRKKGYLCALPASIAAVNACFAAQGTAPKDAYRGRHDTNTPDTQDADVAVRLILARTEQMSIEYILVPCANMGNAMATRDERGIAHIWFDPDFVVRVHTSRSAYWNGVFWLAHELGHLCLGHMADANEADKRQQEAQADQFAGFAMKKMGCPTIDEALAPLQDEYRKRPYYEGSSSYPSRNERLNAIRRGFNGER